MDQDHEWRPSVKLAALLTGKARKAPAGLCGWCTGGRGPVSWRVDRYDRPALAAFAWVAELAGQPLPDRWHARYFARFADPGRTGDFRSGKRKTPQPVPDLCPGALVRLTGCATV